MGASLPHVSRIVTDRVAIDAKKAIVLSEVFGPDPEVFLDLQKKYELAQALRVSRPDPQRALRARLYAGLPVAEMIHRGWIAADGPKDTERVEKELARFFDVADASQIPFLPHAARKSDAGSSPTPTQLAWIYRVRSIAKDQVVGRYSPTAVREAIDKLAELRPDERNVRHVPAILAASGIRYVVVESLSSAKIDGVCFWLNDMAPVVGMTTRQDRIDNFWFVLRHELEHVARGHGRRRERIDVELEGERGGSGPNVPDEERVANAAAADFCAPKEQMDRFVARKSPYFMERDVLGFAATVGVHPGLVVGQLQRRLGRYDRFRKHLVKIRAMVVQTAAVDGWGSIYVVDNNR
jgi:HTH-type transcriptional regulator/antitoxin HigA